MHIRFVWERSNCLTFSFSPHKLWVKLRMLVIEICPGEGFSLKLLYASQLEQLHLTAIASVPAQGPSCLRTRAYIKGTNPALKKPSNIPEIYAKMFGRIH